MIMQKHVNWLATMMLAWTLTSFACHYTAKQFLRSFNVTDDTLAGFVGSLVITGTQMAFCVVLTQNNSSTASKDIPFRLMQMTHVLATLATNFSMSVTHASTTFSIKLMEPITGALAQRVILGSTLTTLQLASLPVIVIGSILLAEDFSSGFSISLGSIIAFTSNILLAIRNVIIKKQHLSDQSLTLNNSPNWMTLFSLYSLLLLLTEGLARSRILPHSVVVLELLVLVSALFHVVYSYISTAVLLNELSVVGHAICNNVKRLSVVGLLFATGRRVTAIWNVYGLILCAAGLAVYSFSKTQTKETSLTSNAALLVRTSKRFVLVLLIVTMCLCTLSAYGQGPDQGSLDVTTSLRDLYQSGRQRLENVVIRYASYNRPLADVTPDVREPYLSWRWYTGNTDSSSPRYLSYKPSSDSSPPLPVEEALRVNLVENPELADAISPYLTNRADVIAEAQRIHMNIFTNLLTGRRNVMLFDYDPSENKGDSAIAVGQFILLQKLNVNVIYKCNKNKCSLDEAVAARGKLNDNDVVILLNGGGNVIGYRAWDYLRHQVIKRFPDFDIIMFPQSIPLYGSQEHIIFCKEIYASHKKLTFLWRDRGSYKLGREMFPKVRSLLSPDIAYQIGPIPRTMAPSHQIIWIKRNDIETPKYKQPEQIKGYTFLVDDWLTWPTPKGEGPMEDVFLKTQVGLTFLQRGRVVVTDRLHGHILSTLLGIPHVFIDNEKHKLSNYHNTWTRSVENLVYTNSSIEAVHHVALLLERLDKSLPPIMGY